MLLMQLIDVGTNKCALAIKKHMSRSTKGKIDGGSLAIMT
jgi:hypothetical protein